VIPFVDANVAIFGGALRTLGALLVLGVIVGHVVFVKRATRSGAGSPRRLELFSMATLGSAIATGYFLGPLFGNASGVIASVPALLGGLLAGAVLSRPLGLRPWATADAAACADVRATHHVLRDPRDGRLGLGRDGDWTAGGEGWPVLATLPPLYPEWLGDRSFNEAHGTRFPYVGGAMANGIATVAMVAELARNGFLGFFGAAGLSPGRVEAAIDYYHDVAGTVLRRSSRRVLLRPTEVPTLAIEGSEDGAVSPKTMAASAKYFRRGYRLIVVPGAGHFVHCERPAEVAGAILDWLRSAP
jgi:pimeloyl-ACP methyl ester carboxylesterase